MALGKRHQVSILVVTGLVTIAVMHLLVFQPKASRFNAVYAQLQAAKTEVGALTFIKDPRQEINKLAATNKQLQTYYEDQITSIGISMPEPFRISTAETVTLTAKESQGKTGGLLDQAKYEKLGALQTAQFRQQTDLVMAKIAELREFDVRTGGKRSIKNAVDPPTAMSFLANDWLMPAALPEGMNQAKLNDALLEASSTLAMITRVEAGQHDLRDRLRAEYEQKLRELGIDYRIYRDERPVALITKGQYLPLLHKLTHAMMIEKALNGPDNMELGPTILTRAGLYEFLEITIPIMPLVDLETGKDMPVNEFYFMYEQLRFVVELLDMCVANNVAEVAGVRFDDSSYLVKQVMSLVHASPVPDKTPQPTPIPYNRFVLPPERDAASGEIIGDPAKGDQASAGGQYDVGYCLPITLQFRATNLNGMKLVYEVTKKYPLSELDSWWLQSTRSPDSTEIWFQVTFVTVPYVFALDQQTKPPVVIPVATPAAAAGATAAAADTLGD